MNRKQVIALIIAAANLIVMLLLPPLDVYSVAKSQLPVFGGFQFVWDPSSVINTGVLALAVMVVLVSTRASQGWSSSRPGRMEDGGSVIRMQR